MTWEALPQNSPLAHHEKNAWHQLAGVLIAHPLGTCSGLTDSSVIESSEIFGQLKSSGLWITCGSLNLWWLKIKPNQNKKSHLMVLETSLKEWGITTTTIRFIFKAQSSGLLRLIAVNFSSPIETVYRIQMLKKELSILPLEFNFDYFTKHFLLIEKSLTYE